ncbi:XRE family transcriptional regulator [Nocardiopsis gilva YIM 90087]|uniref:XRE family transcriptional regulator n=1 Tax=Nocardiopsis gilva YIM 90087 TaxID=1235441 RepID=A0A223S0D5_9ACTN|nr:helix-turn-helix domain-containing protein [Nocardiopsis gilva]ASU81557.1 XRE family transcriptional regulator [Nocardiopsis gilva YIM 90087]
MISIKVDGAKLRRLRESRGLSVVALAAAAGLSKWAIYGIEQGRHQPSPTVYARMKQALAAVDADLEVTPEQAETTAEEVA